ncbi:30S ribosomal protein S5 [archaeon]|nr:MAG: 30S ribosomal protein S5 [archaeon]
MATGKEAKKKRNIPRKETKQEKAEEKNIDTANNIAKEELITAEVEAKKEVSELKEGAEAKLGGTVGGGAPRKDESSWIPKTELGRKVLNNEITDIMQIFNSGRRITEPEIVDALIPNLESEIIMIGGSTGKGGGIRRTPSKRTTRMHKSGRRFTTSALIVAGNRDGLVGLGFAAGPPAKHQELMQKALQKAKLNLIPIRRGCGSWECSCAKPHSIPLNVTGKSGSVVVELKPAPRGIGLCVSDEIKKIMTMAGIKDVWSKTRGQTQSRINLVKAVFDAMKRLDRFKLQDSQEKILGLAEGKMG